MYNANLEQMWNMQKKGGGGVVRYIWKLKAESWKMVTSFLQ